MVAVATPGVVSAQAWVRAALADGPVAASKLSGRARAAGISPAAFVRARALEQVEVVRVDGVPSYRLPGRGRRCS